MPILSFESPSIVKKKSFILLFLRAICIRLTALFSRGSRIPRILGETNIKRIAARASGLRRDFHVAVAVACLRLRPLRFCGLHAGADRFSGCVPAYRARRAAIALALRGKARRRTHVKGAPAREDR